MLSFFSKGAKNAAIGTITTVTQATFLVAYDQYLRNKDRKTIARGEVKTSDNDTKQSEPTCK